ncbi:hypothetical protein HY009_05905 [Candidatus Acetothermia bacterium]|nr:hypothetical protein [Candidatus Acetothermia bacterium]
MASKSLYEGELLAELQELSEAEQAKLLKLIRFLKEEILQESSDLSDKAVILRHAGLLAGLSPEAEQRFMQAVSRRTLFGNRQIRL